MSIEHGSKITEQQIRVAEFQPKIGDTPDFSSTSDRIKKPLGRPPIKFKIEERVQKLFQKSAWEFIWDKYVNEGLSDDLIAKELKLKKGGRFAIHGWREQNGIPSRPKDEAGLKSWKRLSLEERKARIKKMHSRDSERATRNARVAKGKRNLVLKAIQDPDVVSELTDKQGEYVPYRYPKQEDSTLTFSAIGAKIGAKREAVVSRDRRVLKKVRRLLKSKKAKPPVD